MLILEWANIHSQHQINCLQFANVHRKIEKEKTEK